MASNLPDYVASAQPVPQADRVPWFKSTAQTYAGIMLWFVFWESVPASGIADTGGILAQGIGVAILGVIVGGLLCHFASYWAPAMMGMKTGLPLAVVGTSTYGVVGGFLMPGFLMGILQFGWLAVNSYFSAELLAGLAGFESRSTVHITIGIVWALVAAFVGLKGIHYVAKVATFLPLIPFVILLILLGKTASGIGGFNPEQLTGEAAVAGPSSLTIFLVAITNIVGFFATAGAAGVDIASSNRNEKDVQLGGLAGVAGATIFTGCLALLIVAGTYGAGLMEGKDVILEPTKLMETIMGAEVAKAFWLLLAVAAFPPACFSSLIAAASFKNTLPKINPFISCGVGVAGSIALVVSGWAGNAAGVFIIIGASFGPICGAMTADYLLAGKKWPGPRAGFNPAGWISWAIGFIVGAWNSLFVPLLQEMAELEITIPQPILDFQVPCPPMAALIVGFVLYFVLASIGIKSRTLEMPAAQEEPAE